MNSPVPKKEGVSPPVKTDLKVVSKVGNSGAQARKPVSSNAPPKGNFAPSKKVKSKRQGRHPALIAFYKVFPSFDPSPEMQDPDYLKKKAEGRDADLAIKAAAAMATGAVGKVKNLKEFIKNEDPSIEEDAQPVYQGAVNNDGKKLGVKEVKILSSVAELSDFGKPDASIPDSPNKQECIVIYMSNSQTLNILATQDFAQSKPFLAYKNRIKAKSENTTVTQCDPAVILEIKQIFAGKSTRQKAIEDNREKTKARDLFFRIINKGIDFGASDVHICVREETGAVLYRVNGVIRRWNQFLSSNLIQAMAVGYTLDAQEKTRSESAFQADFAQKCMIPFETPTGKKFNLRYQSEPAIGGFDVVIRYLKNSSDVKVLSLKQLGYQDTQEDLLNFSASKAIGVTMIAGVTGSGKTTTLNTLLRTLPDRNAKKIYAYEDPTEYRIPGVTHVSIPARASEDGGNPFLEPMKNFLRLDPDVGMLGEIRDRDSAMILQQAVESGHQIFTTVHATSAFGIIKRLLSPQIGLTREVLGADDFLTSMVYQKLIPINCPHCQVKGTKVLSKQKLALIEAKLEIDVEKLMCASDPGCPECSVSGFNVDNSTVEEGARLGIAGVTVIAEVVCPDDTIRELITAGKDTDAKKYWRGTRTHGFDHEDMTGKLAFEHGLYKVANGIVDVRYLEDAFVGIEHYQVQKIQGHK